MLSEDHLKECLCKKSLNHWDKILIILAFRQDKTKTIPAIKRIGRNAGIPEISIWDFDYLIEFNIEAGFIFNVQDRWQLTSEGKKHVNSLIQTKRSPKVINNAKKLKDEIKKISNSDSRIFLEEAVRCYEAEYYRSCVVLSWVGAISILYDKVVANHLPEFNAEAKRRDSRWKDAKINDDLARMKDSDFLDIIGSPPISLIGKSVKEELKNNCLQLRNASGHPSSLKIGENRTSSHLEILILNIFSKFP